jgi:ArsR family transcriptional regulator
MEANSGRDVGCCPLFDAPLGPEQAIQLARDLRALADPARLRILSLISSHPRGEVCQAEFTGPLALAQPTVSHHLKVLHDSGFIQREQRGSWAYYRLVPERVKSLLDALRPGHEHGSLNLHHGRSAAPSR